MKLANQQQTMDNKRQNMCSVQKGFTFIEILVYIAILSVLVLVISSFVLWSVRSNAKARAMRETINSARRALEVMTYEIRQADSIYSPATRPDQLSLETKEYLPTGEETSYVDFYLCGQQLCLKKESQEAIALTSEEVSVSALTFTQIGTDFLSIKINLTVDYKNPQNRIELQASVDLTSTVALRTY